METEIKEEKTVQTEVKVEKKPKKKISKKAIIGIAVGGTVLVGATVLFVVTKGKTGNPVKAAEAAATVATAAI